MRLLKTVLISVFAVACISSCRQEEALDTFKGADFVFVGVSETLEGESVEWSASTKVSVLDGVSNVLYQPLSSGVRPRFSSKKGVDDNAMDIFAIWPYSEEHELVYGGLKAYLKAEHDSSEEIEGLCIAHASEIGQEEELNFVNVVSYLRVTLTEDMGVVGMTFSGLSSEVLAGLAEVVIAQDGTPAVGSVTKSSRKVSLVSQEKLLSGTFLIPIFPTVMENGCVLEFLNSEGCQAKAEKKEKLTFRRNEVVDFGDIPESLQWQKAPKAQVHGITSNEIVLSWSASSWIDTASDFLGKYTVGLYSDADCTEPIEIVEWDMEGQSMPEDLTRLAYVFSGLQPATDYWAKVTDTQTNASADIISVATLKEENASEVAEEGDYALFDNFSSMVFGGDVVSGVYGKDMDGVCVPEKTVNLNDVPGWIFEGSATSHSGYVGFTGQCSLTSEKMASLKETATVALSFMASGSGEIKVHVVDAKKREGGSVVLDGSEWKRYSIELLNVSPVSKICIECMGGTMYMDNISALVQKYEVVSNAPSVEVGKVFWSDGYILWRSRLGEPDGYNIYVDGAKINDEVLPSHMHEYHLTDLAVGREHSVVVAAVMGGREDKAEPVAVHTGTITQITTNLSPRSLSVAIENRAGGPANTVSPALYVELYQDGKEEPLFSSIVVDGLATIQGQSFVTSLALSSAKDQRPTNVTFGRLEPSTAYRFRVRSYASYIFKNRVSSTAGSEAEVTSPNGDSEWSDFVSFTTPAEHVLSSDEVLFQGFDGCSINQDFMNKAVGSVPSYKAAGVKVGTLSYSSLYSWGSENWAFYPLRMAHPSSQFAQYAWITGIGGNQKYPCTTGSNSTATAPEFLKGASAYKCNDNASPDLQDWYISNSAWPYQGYIGLGTDYTAADGATDDKLAFVITEALEKNLTESETMCTLTFKGLAMYGKAISINIAKLSPDGTWTEPVSIPLMNSAGTTEAVTAWPVGDNHKWHEHTCQISLKKGDRVGIATNKGGHALIDDIQIKVN